MDEDFLVGSVFAGKTPVLLQKLSRTGRVTVPLRPQVRNEGVLLIHFYYYRTTARIWVIFFS